MRVVVRHVLENANLNTSDEVVIGILGGDVWR